jgi:hypothetical protein
VRIALLVEDRAQQLGGGYAIHHRMVGLGEQCPAALAEPLDHPRLPQRLVAIELLGHHPSDQQPQLLVATRVGQRGAAQVVGEVEMRVVDPDGPTQGQRHEVDALPVAGNLRQLGPDTLDELLVRRRRPLEDRHRSHVHVADAVLEVQERRVLGR